MRSRTVSHRQGKENLIATMAALKTSRGYDILCDDLLMSNQLILHVKNVKNVNIVKNVKNVM